MHNKLLLVLLYSITSLYVHGLNLQREYISFSDNYLAGCKTYSPSLEGIHGMNIASGRKGEINLVFDESFPDSVKWALELSKDIWEHKLRTVQPIVITVGMESMDTNIVVDTEVGYVVGGSLDMIGCPSSLASQLRNYPLGSPDAPDARITLNDNLYWDVTTSGISNDKYSAVSVGLRAIAMALGFGSSIRRKVNLTAAYVFSAGVPSFFDKMVHSGDTYLSDFTSGTFPLSQFVRSDLLKVQGLEDDYDLYAPSSYEPMRSMIYLKDRNSIMSAYFGCGSRFFYIDSATTDILNKLGWSTTDHEERYSIECVDADGDGVECAYLSHEFRIQGFEDEVSGYEWIFFLKDMWDNYIEIQRSTDSYFKTQPIDNLDGFKIDANGFLVGKIECSYSIDGKTHDAYPFFLTLSIQPQILSIDNIRSIKTGPYTFKVSCLVNYVGSDHVTVGIEEEYSSSYRTYVFEEPLTAHVVTGNMSSLHNNWIDIMVKNNYGMVSERMVFPTSNDNFEFESNQLESRDTECGSIIHVFNQTGKCVFIGQESDFDTYRFPFGVYYKKVMSGSDFLTSKLIIP